MRCRSLNFLFEEVFIELVKWSEIFNVEVKKDPFFSAVHRNRLSPVACRASDATLSRVVINAKNSIHTVTEPVI